MSQWERDGLFSEKNNLSPPCTCFTQGDEGQGPLTGGNSFGDGIQSLLNCSTGAWAPLGRAEML